MVEWRRSLGVGLIAEECDREVAGVVRLNDDEAVVVAKVARPLRAALRTRLLWSAVPYHGVDRRVVAVLVDGRHPLPVVHRARQLREVNVSPCPQDER